MSNSSLMSSTPDPIDTLHTILTDFRIDIKNLKPAEAYVRTIDRLNQLLIEARKEWAKVIHDKYSKLPLEKRNDPEFMDAWLYTFVEFKLSNNSKGAALNKNGGDE